MTMTKTTKRITMVSLAAAGLLVLGAAVAGPRLAEHAGCGMGGFGGGGFGGGFGRLHHLLADLDLTDAQKSAIKEVLAAEQPNIEPLIDRKIETHKALFQAVHAAALDESAVRAAAKRAAAADVDLAVEKAVLFSKLRGLLTTEQRERVDTLLKRFEDKLTKRVDLGRSIWREHTDDFIDAL
jgi:Spy/CpxP family protein refolding chaperone